MNGSDRPPLVASDVSEDHGGPIFWPYGPADPGAAATLGPGSGMVNLGYIGAAIGRGKRIWLTLAVLGLLVGCGLFVTAHSSYSASVSILLSEDPQGEIGGVSTDTVLAKDPKMAAIVVRELGLSMTPYEFLDTYSAVENTANTTDLVNGTNILNSPVLVMTATAKTGAAATSQANAIAVEFLKFRAAILQGQVTASDAAANQEVVADRSALTTLQKQVRTLSAEPSSTAQQQQLSMLQSEEKTASSALSAAEQTEGAAKAARQLTVSSMISGTQILYATPAALSVSRKTAAIEYIGVPFVGCLMIGLGIVVVGAVTSNRLRRRDDIAAALGVPVRLSVSAYAGGSRRLPGRQRETADVRRVVGHLKSVLQGAVHRPATLAIVAVDNAPAVVSLVKVLAAAFAEERKRVAVADLSNHLLARELGESQPGVHKTRVHGAGVLLVVPEIGRELETGPLSRVEPDSAASSAVAAAYADADVCLVVVSFDPAFGGDHIATWATQAVVVVTAGASSAAKIQSAGEMLRAAGVHVTSAVVLGADRDDDSPGNPMLS